MSGRGHRRLRLCSKKNYERKKYQARSVDASNDARHDAPQSSSIELSDDSVSTITELRDGLQLLDSLNGNKVPLFYILIIYIHILGWIVSFSEQVLRVCKLRCSDTSAQVNFCVAVKSNFSWVVTYRDSTLETDKCTNLSHIPAVLDSGMSV